MLPLYPLVRKWSLEDHCTFPCHEGVVKFTQGAVRFIAWRQSLFGTVPLTLNGGREEGPFYFDLSSIPAVSVGTNGPTNRYIIPRGWRETTTVPRRAKNGSFDGAGAGGKHTMAEKETAEEQHGHSGGAAASYISRQDRRTHRQLAYHAVLNRRAGTRTFSKYYRAIFLSCAGWYSLILVEFSSDVQYIYIFIYLYIFIIFVGCSFLSSFHKEKREKEKKKSK